MSEIDNQAGVNSAMRWQKEHQPSQPDLTPDPNFDKEKEEIEASLSRLSEEHVQALAALSAFEKGQPITDGMRARITEFLSGGEQKLEEIAGYYGHLKSSIAINLEAAKLADATVVGESGVKELRTLAIRNARIEMANLKSLLERIDKPNLAKKSNGIFN